MTVVAAVARNGIVTMAADTATNYQGTYVMGARKIRLLRFGAPNSTLRADPVLGTALIAGAGNGAILNVLERKLHVDDVPDPDDLNDVAGWADTIAEAATETLADTNPPLLDSHNGSQTIDGAFLLGWHGHLLYLFTHQAHRLVDCIGALGSGADIAFGALYAGLDLERTPLDAVLGAVRIASERCEGCRLDDLGPLVGRIDTRPGRPAIVGYCGNLEASALEVEDAD